ncbi:MAG: DUF1525 domain-containing protein [Candidatus Nitrosotenuis sp.]|nr:MAG: DUF1525 domain-containing protein [Candidatus Nitrosotenuis sp.]
MKQKLELLIGTERSYWRGPEGSEPQNKERKRRKAIKKTVIESMAHAGIKTHPAVVIDDKNVIYLF